MPEPENPKTRKPRQKTTAKKTEEPPRCHVHNEVDFEEVDEIRKKVCVNDEPLGEFEGKYYCLFHLPIKEKNNNGKFEEIFRERLIAIETKIADAEELPEAEREAAIS